MVAKLLLALPLSGTFSGYTSTDKDSQFSSLAEFDSPPPRNRLASRGAEIRNSKAPTKKDEASEKKKQRLRSSNQPRVRYDPRTNPKPAHARFEHTHMSPNIMTTKTVNKRVNTGNFLAREEQRLQELQEQRQRLQEQRLQEMSNQQAIEEETKEMSNQQAIEEETKEMPEPEMMISTQRVPRFQTEELNVESEESVDDPNNVRVKPQKSKKHSQSRSFSFPREIPAVEMQRMLIQRQMEQQRQQMQQMQQMQQRQRQSQLEERDSSTKENRGPSASRRPSMQLQNPEDTFQQKK